MPENSIFRKKALERLSSPEKLDQLVEIVGRRDWIALLALALLVLGGLVWSIVGRLPTTVQGTGVLARPRKVIEFQAPSSGRLIGLNVRAGDLVEKGDSLGTVEQAELRKQMQQEQVQLAELQAQDRAKGTLLSQRRRLEAQETAEEQRFQQLQRANRENSVKDAETLAPVLKRRLESRRAMAAQGLLPAISEDVLEAERTYLDNQATISSLRAQLKELESQGLQLEGRQRILVQEDFESSSARKNEIQAVMARIALFEVQLKKNSEVVSEYRGRVLEVAANAGQFVTDGQRLGSLEVDDPGIQPMGIVYFPVKDGKKIQPGMPIQFTPDTVQRERFGSIVGTVVSVSSFPVTKAGAASLIGNPEIAESLLSNGPQIEVVADLERDTSVVSGYRWSSSKGPSMRITPGLTATARVTVEGRAPITYLLPFLRSTVGVY